jgi:hypothetical protein
MTYRFSGDVQMDGSDNIHVSTMLAPGEFPVPMPTVLAGWWGYKFNRLFLNNVAMPKPKRGTVSICCLRGALPTSKRCGRPPTGGHGDPGEGLPRPYRGERIERSLR